MAGVEEFELPRKAAEVRPLYLVRDKLLEEAQLKKPYQHVPPKVYEQVEASWFAFYDSENLRNVLGTLMPLIAKYSKDWAASCVKQR